MSLCRLAAAAVSGALAVSAWGEQPAVAPGSARMAGYLARTARTADPVTNIYLNRARAEGIRSLLGGPMSAAKELQLRVTVARELLRGGLFREAGDELELITTEIDRRQLPAEESFLRMLRDLRAIAALRVGEQASGRRPAHGWIFPMARGGGAPFDAGAREAIALYSENLRRRPGDLATRWLLNIAFMAVGEYPEGVPAEWRLPPEAFAPESPVGGFADVAAAAGVDVLGHAGGSVMEDLDGDGLLDLVASSRGLQDQLRYFRSRGDGTFEDRTREAGLTGQLGGLNLSHADYDNDGDRDLTVWRGAWMGEAGRHPNSLLRNDGGRFEDVTKGAGLLSFHPTHSGAWGDLDNDGWLDLYVGNESSPAPRPEHPNELFRNDGDGTFTEVARSAGVAGVGFVKGVTLGDYDNDGLLDLYLSHLKGENALFHNLGSAGGVPRFADSTAAAGVGAPHVSFPTWFWDYDNDGWQDLFVAGFDMEDLGDMAAVHVGLPFGAEHAHLYRNEGDGTFSEVSAETGLDRVILVMGANFGDLDGDGWLDACFGTGMPDMRTLMPNRMFRNDGGRRFQDVTAAGGFGHLQKGHGISFGDLDGDGDQDVHQVLGAAFEGDVYENVLLENPGHGNHWLTLHLEGVRSNRDALGARIRVRVRRPAGAERDIFATVGTGGSFGSSPFRQEIGLGDAAAVVLVEVTWPATGQVQRFEGLFRDRAYRLRESEPAAQPVARRRFDLSP